MKNLNQFKKTLKKSLLLEPKDQELFDKIPDKYFSSIFNRNFNGDYHLAESILLNYFDQDTYENIEKEKLKIKNLKKSTDMISDAIENNNPIAFITDNDNDGSLAQAGIFEFLTGLSEKEKSEIYIQYAQTVNKNNSRGITIDLVELWAKENEIDTDKEFVLITADNGINSRDEQIKINKKFPKAKIIITDHHLPDPDQVVIENKNTIIFNPKYKPTKYFETKNISGANTTTVLLKNVLKSRQNNYIKKENVGENEQELMKHELQKISLNMDNIARIANMLDYVETDITDKPLKDYTIEKFNDMGTLLNVNNSLNKMVTGELNENTIETILKNSDNGLDIDKVKDLVRSVKRRNVMAMRLLKIKENYDKLERKDKDGLKAKDFSDSLSNALIDDSIKLEKNINPNYVEQLRPIIYHYSSKEQNIFEASITEGMTKVYQDLRGFEKALSHELRKSNIMNAEKLDNSTIMYPIDPAVLTVFNRKFLGKVYNEENNGFLMILDSLDKNKASGSFRSLFRIQDILEGKENIENLLNIKINFQGHDKAAGFFITSEEKEISPRIITEVNRFINTQISKIKEKESLSNSVQLLTDLDSVGVIDKINKKVKGNLSNMNCINPLIKFNKSTYLTEHKSLEQKNLQQLIKDQKYGYVVVNMNFKGDAIILPTELLRQVVNNNFKDYLEINYLDNGVFMASRIARNVNTKKLVNATHGDKEANELLDYYIEHFHNNPKNEVDIDRWNLMKIPYFKNNRHGEEEFGRYEDFAIRIIESLNVDELCIFDTEGTGLGQAPKLFNFGALNLSVDDKSGFKMSKEEFDKAHFKSNSGDRFLLSKKQKTSIKKLTENQYEKLSFAKKQQALKGSDDEHYWYEGEINFKKLNNFKDLDDGQVWINRTLKGTMLSYIVKDNDFKLTSEITNLTNIKQFMLNKVGISSRELDEKLMERYKDKKTIFQAHNLPYDSGICKANLIEFSKHLNQSLLSDSAIYSRTKKLAYDNIKVARFDKIAGLKSIVFYNDEYSDVSAKNFISNNKDELLPDRSGDYVLKKEDGEITLINKKTNTEIKIDATLEDLGEFMMVDDMPNNKIKYSVEALSLHETVRSILLADGRDKIKHINVPSKWQEKKSEMQHFMMHYHFDNDIETNIRNFLSSVGNETKDFFGESKETMEEFFDFAREFLESNKETQQKFTDAWIYKKVLNLYDPEKNEINDEVITNLSYQTDLSEKKVKTILDDIVYYKEKFGLKHAVVHEVHNNIVFDGDNWGDVMLEGVATLKRLVDTNYNSYKNDSEMAVNMYINNVIKTTSQNTLRQIKEIANDSYSSKQGRAYRRINKTDQIKSAQNKNPAKVQLKCSSSTLPPNTFVYGELKESISEERLDDISKKIEYIIKNKQLKNSVDKSKMNGETKDNIMTILEANDSICQKYEDDIKTSLRYVEFSRREEYKKRVGEQLFDICGGSADITVSRSFEDFDQKEIQTFFSLLDEYEGIFNKLGVQVERKNAEKFLYSLPCKDPFDMDEELKKSEELNKDNHEVEFLPEVNIMRRDPINWMLKNAPELLDGSLENSLKLIYSENNDEVIEQKLKQKLK
jgi:single-stranded DNA-specific DHH superfamily exonuclease